MFNVFSINSASKVLTYFLISLLLSACSGGSSSGKQTNNTPSLQSLSLSTPPTTMISGETFQASVTGLYTDDSSFDLSSDAGWSSSDTNILTVSDSGLITAINAGSTTITAAFSGESASFSINVIALSSIAMSIIPDDLEVGDSVQLSANGTYTDSSSEDISNDVIWASSNNTAISISATGLLSVNTAGSATISIEHNDLLDQQDVEVVVLYSVSITTLPSDIEVGSIQQLVANAHYSNSTTSIITSAANWSSSDPSILHISNEGLLTALAPGDATITASYEGEHASSTSTAYTLSSLSITPAALTLAIASSHTLTATGIYTNNTTSDLSPETSWQSSNNNIATVDENGLVVAVSAGNTNVTASIGDINTSLELKVSPATLHSISIDLPDTLIAGLTTALSATGTYSDGSTQNITAEVTWQTSDISLASIDNELITAIQSGEVQVSAIKGSTTGLKNIVISPAQIDSLVLTPPLITLAKGTQSEVNVTAIFTDQSHQDVTSQVNWSADSPEIISIEAGSSLVSGLDIGSSSLSAELDGHNAASTVTVSNAVLSNISILPINSSLPKGLSQSFSAQGTYSDGSVQDITEQVTWTSSDSAIGSISNAALSEGLVNGLELGFVNISATLDDISISTSLSIQDAVLTAIEVQPGNISLANGLQIQAIALGSYSDGEQIDISKEANWNTSSSTVASVESPSAPAISANAEGEALISAELEGISGISLVTVTSATLQSISLTSDNTSIPAGFTEQVKASGLYTDASTKDITHLVTWQSEDNQLITVDNNVDSPGLIRTVAPGSTRVSASFEGLSSSATFTVTDAILSSIAITSPASAINVNDELQLSAIADYSDNSSKDLTQEVSWIISDNDVVSIETASNDYFSNQSGLLKALSAGTSDISAQLLNSSGELISSNTLSLTISEDPNATKAISLSLTPNVILNNGIDSSIVSATLSPNSASGAIPDNTEVSFSITDNGTTHIETAYTSNGVAQITLSSENIGLISIEASSNQIHSSSAIYSTNDFRNVIVSYAEAEVLYDAENEVLKSGSTLLTLVRNLSNRDFDLPLIAVMTGNPDPQIHLPESPFDTSLLTGDQVLSGGETNAFGYALSEDVSGSIFYILYALSDDTTNTDFISGSVFSFQ